MRNHLDCGCRSTVSFHYSALQIATISPNLSMHVMESHVRSRLTCYGDAHLISHTRFRRCPYRIAWLVGRPPECREIEHQHGRFLPGPMICQRLHCMTCYLRIVSDDAIILAKRHDIWCFVNCSWCCWIFSEQLLVVLYCGIGNHGRAKSIRVFIGA